ncbi:hypothetical protein AJ88_03600 [Mesorhizobium amorphae CCBAU 01583]|nr:hypothetical protein AJ88_03600 [Mesorhizobium amorphae CCBAU 01583]
MGHERTVGRLSLSEGDGPPNAEAAIIALIEAPALSGQIAIAQSFVEVSSPGSSATYGALPEGAATIFVIPTSAVHSIAQTLLKDAQ